jgi:hypothetical protein
LSYLGKGKYNLVDSVFWENSIEEIAREVIDRMKIPQDRLHFVKQGRMRSASSCHSLPPKGIFLSGF